jgi:hypothetical protein
MRTRTRRTCRPSIVARVCLFAIVLLSGFAVLPTQTGHQHAWAATASVDNLLARCPTADEIAAIEARTSLKFEQDPTAGTLVCAASDGSADLTLLQERAYQALLVMHRLCTSIHRFPGPRHRSTTGSRAPSRGSGFAAISPSASAAILPT